MLLEPEPHGLLGPISCVPASFCKGGCAQVRRLKPSYNSPDNPTKLCIFLDRRMHPCTCKSLRLLCVLCPSLFGSYLANKTYVSTVS